ncbi:MAG: homocysteine S-methyltransferase family protein [Pirellulaceae bacterium]
MTAITILDGPLGTQLDTRGVATDSSNWSAAAIYSHPDVIRQIHRDYALAGATVHTANTFRTQRRSVGDAWESMARQAVQLTRDAIGDDLQLAGSIAPLADCYRPDLSPAITQHDATIRHHREMAEVLADADCDLLLCETFANVSESLIAVQQAVKTGVETWLALTAGPNANLLSPEEMAKAAQQAVDLGVAVVLVNCVAATKTLAFVQALADAGLGVPIGAYANAGYSDDPIGWNDNSVQAYLNHTKSWRDAGASIIGGCCGTTPRHIAAITSL